MSSAEPFVCTIATFSHRGRLILDANIAHRGFKPTDGSSKIQAPNSNEIPSPKFQKLSDVLELGAWRFSGAWMLVLGASKRGPQFALVLAPSLARQLACGH